MTDMMDSPQEHLEHAEHAKHVAHSGDEYLTIVSISIAVLAVIAATIGSLETMETAKAIGGKNNAVLLQSKASDTWAFFQAKSMKQSIYALAAEQAGAKPEYRDKARRYETEKADIEKQARDLEQKSREALEVSEGHEHRHHILTVAVTLLHIAIAIATIAIIAHGRRWPWHSALLLGFFGVVAATFAYI